MQAERILYMNVIDINERISYIEATDDPLSADIGIIRCNDTEWLYDVGNDERSLAGLKSQYNVVLSHFHQDHTGCLDKVQTGELYVSGETFRHTGRGIIADRDLAIGDLHIFPIPSSHTKGCLGLEVAGEYAFVGDALYSKVKDGYYVYNAQLLKDEIATLKKLKASKLLVSHFKGLIRPKHEVIEELEQIYSMREKNNPDIRVGK